MTTKHGDGWFFNVRKNLENLRDIFLCGYLTVTTKHKKVEFAVLQTVLRFAEETYRSLWIPYGDNEAESDFF